MRDREEEGENKNRQNDRKVLTDKHKSSCHICTNMSAIVTNPQTTSFFKQRIIF